MPGVRALGGLAVSDLAGIVMVGTFSTGGERDGILMGAGVTLLAVLLGWAFFLQRKTSSRPMETWRGRGFLIDAGSVRVGPATVHTEGSQVLAMGIDRVEQALSRGVDERLLVGITQQSLEPGVHVYRVGSLGWRTGGRAPAVIEADSTEAGVVFTSQVRVGGLPAGRRSEPAGLFQALEVIRAALTSLSSPPPVTVVLLGRKHMEALDVGGPALLLEGYGAAPPGTRDALASEKARKDLARVRDPANQDSIAERVEKHGWSMSLVH